MHRAVETDWGWRWTGKVGRAGRLTEQPTKKQIGRWGEWLALRHLRRLGWDIVARNWQTKRGEVDLIAYDRAQLVMVEVKTRLQRGFRMLPEENFGRRKLRKLEALAMDFLRRYELADCPVRFDLIAVETPDLRRFELRHTFL